MRWDDVIKWISAAIGAIAGAVGGAWTGALTCLLALNVVDYVSGLICAALGRSTKTDGGRLSSTAGFIGLARKMFIWVLILVATLVDRYVIGTGESCVIEIDMTNDVAADEGMVCGGTMKVLVEDGTEV